MSTPKRKSQLRFEQLNLIVDEVAPSLRSPSQVAVLVVCYRHASPSGKFGICTARIAKSSKLSHRQARRVLDELEALGVIKSLSDHVGPIAKQYRITGKRANGDMGDPIKHSRTKVNGDMGDR